MIILRGFAREATNSLSVFRADEAARGGRVFGDELFGLLDRAVENRDLKAVVGDVEREILTHHGETDESDVRVRFGHRSCNL